MDTRVFCPVDEARKRNLRCQLDLPLAHRIVTFVGRLVTYKGLPLLVRVWRELRATHPNAKLLLVGTGGLDMHNCEQELRAFVEEAGLVESILFLGNVCNVQEYLQASDVFVFPTENDAFGIALIDAMACGLPVISTTVGSISGYLAAQLQRITGGSARL